jgi:putative addiction module component (TIGR02574 family)
MSRDDIRALAMDLPIAERRALAFELLESTDEAIQNGPLDLDPAIEEAWYAEIQRRRKLIESGEMKLIPWEEVEARVFGPDE